MDVTVDKILKLTACLILLSINSTNGGLIPKGFYLADETPPVKISFLPEDGLKNRALFQEKYGIRGERLIERLGQGVSPDDVSFIEEINFNLAEEPAVAASKKAITLSSRYSAEDLRTVIQEIKRLRKNLSDEDDI